MPGHNTRPYARLPPSFLSMDAWITSQLNVALIRKLLGYAWRIVVTCYAWEYVQPGTIRRPVDWCRN